MDRGFGQRRAEHQLLRPPADRQWHQGWVGGDGTILHLHGGMFIPIPVAQGKACCAEAAQPARGARALPRVWAPL
ncbi:MAG: hypothetical protein M3480_09240 [Verrucomicrobiota bacterium]|nr:hypothetical protein [Verrucomicrobiota bacterium]